MGCRELLFPCHIRAHTGGTLLHDAVPISSRSAFLKTLEEGDTINLAVDPEDPDNAKPRRMVDEAPLVRIGPVTAHNMVFLGIGFVVLGLGLIVFGRSG